MQVIKTLENKASTDLSAKVGYCVEFDTSGVDTCDAITDKVVGVVTKGGETESDVCIWGDCQAVAGGTFLAGQHLTSHTDGTVVVTASTSQDFAIALQDAVAGDMANIFVLGVSKYNT
jgi:hypothetical protein